MKKLLIILTINLLTLMNPLIALAEGSNSVFDLSYQITSSIYEVNASQEWIQAEDIESKLGEPDQVHELEDRDASQWTYLLEDDQYEIELILVYVDQYQGFAESIANVDLKDSQSAPLDLDVFKGVGQELKDTYLDQETMTYQELSNLLPPHSSISLIHDLIVFHFDGASDEETYALTTLDDEVISFNYQIKNDEKNSLQVESAQLDNIHHRSNSNVNNVMRLIGKPMAINYDLINGMVTYGWFSNQEGEPEGIQEVYFYEDFYGGMIALSYE